MRVVIAVRRRYELEYEIQVPSMVDDSTSTFKMLNIIYLKFVRIPMIMSLVTISWNVGIIITPAVREQQLGITFLFSFSFLSFLFFFKGTILQKLTQLHTYILGAHIEELNSKYFPHFNQYVHWIFFHSLFIYFFFFSRESLRNWSLTHTHSHTYCKL